LPIWRTTEVLRHAAWLSRRLGGDDDTQIRFRARYTGLAGRNLTAWATRWTGMVGRDYRSRTDIVDLAHSATVGQIERETAPLLLALLTPLYDRFGGYELKVRLVEDQLAEMPEF